MFGEAGVAVGLVGVLFAAGWLFLDHNLLVDGGATDKKVSRRRETLPRQPWNHCDVGQMMHCSSTHADKHTRWQCPVLTLHRCLFSNDMHSSFTFLEVAALLRRRCTCCGPRSLPCPPTCCCWCPASSWGCCRTGEHDATYVAGLSAHHHLCPAPAGLPPGTMPLAPPDRTYVSSHSV